MFCPNCGNDCGDFRFCPNCGTQVQNIQTKVALEPNRKQGNTTIPTSGGYLAVGGSVVLSDSAISICVNSLFKKHRTWIPYDQLVTVIYSRPAKHGGALLFRGESNKAVPIPEKERLFTDKSAVALSQEVDTLFYHIFYMLKAVAPSSTRFEMIVPSTNMKGLEEMARNIDVNDFFDRYAPHRDRAISGIQAKYGIPQEAARALVNRVFDARQREMYSVDPLDAIRDLNLIVDDMRKKEERANHADAEQRKRQERDAVRSSLESLERKKTIEMLDDYLDRKNR